MAARPRTLPATITPVLVGTAAAAREGRFDPLVFVATLAAALLLQVGTNFVNDVADFLRGADRARKGPTRVTQSGLLTPRQVIAGSVAVFGLATLIGLYLVSVGGAPILLIGVFAIASAVAYTAGPFPLAYHGLGDVFAFVFFGVIAVTGTHFLQAGAWTALAVAASLPIACLVTNILVVNNLRDIDTDRAAGKHTLAVRIGARWTRRQYAAQLGLAYAIPAVLVATGLAGPFVALAWLTAPAAVSTARLVWAARETPEFNRALGRTAQLELWFGAALALGLVLR